jgi:hypothetical protein
MQQPKNYTSANCCERNAALVIYVELWTWARHFYLTVPMEKNRPLCRSEFPISKKGGVGFGDPTPFFTTICTRGKPNAAVPDY